MGMPRSNRVMPVVGKINLEGRNNRIKDTDERFLRVFKISSMFSK